MGTMKSKKMLVPRGLLKIFDNWHGMDIKQSKDILAPSERMLTIKKSYNCTSIVDKQQHFL